MLPRHFFTAKLDPDAVPGMRLAEGQGLALIPAAELIAMPRIIPYDATVIWQHLSRDRF